MTVFYKSISIFHAKCDELQLLNFYKANPALEYNLQPVYYSSLALIMMTMMMTIGVSRSVLPR